MGWDGGGGAGSVLLGYRAARSDGSDRAGAARGHPAPQSPLQLHMGRRMADRRERRGTRLHKSAERPGRLAVRLQSRGSGRRLAGAELVGRPSLFCDGAVGSVGRTAEGGEELGCDAARGDVFCIWKDKSRVGRWSEGGLQARASFRPANGRRS